MNTNRFDRNFASLISALLGFAWAIGVSSYAIAGPVSSGSFAGGTAAVDNPVWYDPENPMCKQGCTYDKAVEMISLMAETADTELEMVRKDHNSSAGLQALAGFCTDRDSGDACFDRYERYQILYLSKLRGEMARLETAHASLYSKRVTISAAGGKSEEGSEVAVVAVETKPGDKPTKAALPYFTSLKEVSEKYEKDAKVAGPSSVSQGFKDWLDNYPHEPAKEDFVLTKKILRDPSNPKAGEFTVVDMEADGKTPRVDKEAYVLAIKAYADALKHAGGVTDQAQLKKFYSTAEIENAKKKFYFPKFKPDAISKKAFIEARHLFIQSTDEHIKKTQGNSPVVADVKSAPPANGRVPSAVPPAAAKTAAQTADRQPNGSTAVSVGDGVNGVKPLASAPGKNPTGDETYDVPAGFKSDETLKLDRKYLGKQILERINNDVADTPAVELPKMDE